MENIPAYGRDLTNIVSEAAAFLTLDYPKEELLPLVVNMIQIGIDIHGSVLDNGEWMADSEFIELWNHNAYFDYCLRWMTQDYSIAKQMFQDKFPGYYIADQQTGSSQFINMLWDVYAGDLVPFRSGEVLNQKPKSLRLIQN